MRGAAPAVKLTYTGVKVSITRAFQRAKIPLQAAVGTTAIRHSVATFACRIGTSPEDFEGGDVPLRWCGEAPLRPRVGPP